MHFDDATHDDAAPSRQELLERAAVLGPRRTYASILMPTDPILSRKMQPSVAERRARLRVAVKIAVGVCVAFCVFAATRASAMSVASSTKSAAPVAAVPASPVTPVEKLEQAETTKAPSHGAPQHAAGAPIAARWKHR